MENARMRATSSYIGRICAAVEYKTRAPAKRRIYEAGRPPNH